MDRQEEALAIMAVSKRQLLVKVDDIDRLIDIQRHRKLYIAGGPNIADQAPFITRTFQRIEVICFARSGVPPAAPILSRTIVRHIEGARNAWRMCGKSRLHIFTLRTSSYKNKP